jgi:hypothetical protein
VQVNNVGHHGEPLEVLLLFSKRKGNLSCAEIFVFLRRKKNETEIGTSASDL